jgi:hypothetical protein
MVSRQGGTLKSANGKRKDGRYEKLVGNILVFDGAPE